MNNRSDDSAELMVYTIYGIVMMLGLITWLIFERPTEVEAKRNMYVLFTKTCGEGAMNEKMFNKLNENERLELILACKEK